MADDYCKRCGVSLGLQDLSRSVMLCEKCDSIIRAQNREKILKARNEPDLLDDLINNRKQKKENESYNAAQENLEKEAYWEKLHEEAEEKAINLDFNGIEDRRAWEKKVKEQLGASYSYDFKNRFRDYCREYFNIGKKSYISVILFFLFGFIGIKFFNVYCMFLFAISAGLVCSGIRQKKLIDIYNRYGIFKFNGNIDKKELGSFSNEDMGFMALVFNIDPNKYLTSDLFFFNLILEFLIVGIGIGSLISHPFFCGLLGLIIGIILVVIIKNRISKLANRTAKDIVPLGFEEEYDIDLRDLSSNSKSQMMTILDRIKDKKQLYDSSIDGE